MLASAAVKPYELFKYNTFNFMEFTAIKTTKRHIFLLQLLALAFAYYYAGRLGSFLAIPPNYATIVWPASGIALGGMLVLGYRAWFGIFLGAFLVNLFIANNNVDISNYQLFVFAGMSAGGSVLQAVVGTYLLKRFANFPNHLASEYDVSSFMFYGGVLSALVNSSISTVTLLFTNKIPLNNFLTNWFSWWLGDVVGIFIFTPIMLALFFRKYDYFQDRKIIITVISLTTFLLITLLFYYEKQQELARLKFRFNQQSIEIQTELERIISKNLDVLYSLQILYASSENINQHEFQIAATSFIAKRSGIHALGWSPVVLDSNRKEFETTIRKNEMPNFQMTELDAERKHVPVTTHDKYVPVIYIEPISVNKAAIGYNLYSEKSRQDILDTARDTNEITITARITLVQNQQKKLGAFIAYIPTYKNGAPHATIEQRRENIIGYISAVFEIDELINSAINSPTLNKDLQNLIQNKKLSLHIIDETNPNNEDAIFSTKTKSLPLFDNHSFVHYSNIYLGNHKWRFEITPTIEYFISHESENSLSSLIIILFLTGMIVASVLVSSGRGYLLKELVNEQTQALNKSEQRLIEILNLMPLPVFIKDNQSRITFMNVACDQQWGISFSDLQNKTGVEFFPPEQIQIFLEQDKIIFAEGKEFESDEVVWNARLKINRVVHTYKKPVFDETGKPDYLIGVSIDITESREYQQSILEAKRLAELLAKSKSEFLANMSHEIRTPMNAIIGLSQLALNKEMPNNIREYLEKIYGSSESLLAILNDILDFSKIESGMLRIDPTPFNLVVLLRNLHNLFSISAEKKNLDFAISVEPNIPTGLVGDALRIQQILSNLLGNAIKFTKKGKVELKIQLLESQKETIKVRFSIIDTGIGIKKENQETLFNAFSQADNSITRRFGGTGLGLTISRNLLHLMDGKDFEIDSVENKGTRISFELMLNVMPAEMCDETPIIQSNQNTQGDLATKLQELGKTLFGLKILLAEDNVLNQEIACGFLKLSGMEIDVAGNGLEALALLENRTYDAILMDVNMPKMSGIEATVKIREQVKYAKLPIIALTAGVTSEEQARCLSSGMNDFVTKPLNPEQLLAMLVHYTKSQMES